MKLYIGVTKESELVYIEWDKVDNEQRKTFSLTGGTYGEPKTERQGEDEAREILKESSYYEDLGYLGKTPNFLINYIDFDKVADYIINNDGWEMTNGEFNHFGEYKGEEIYLNCLGGGQHREESKNLKDLWISKAEYKEICETWENEHLKPLKKETVCFMNKIFEKYKSLCSDEEALIKYLECIEWQQ